MPFSYLCSGACVIVVCPFREASPCPLYIPSQFPFLISNVLHLQFNVIADRFSLIPRGMRSFGNFWGGDRNFASWWLTFNQGDANNTVAGTNPYDPFTPTSLAAAVAGNHHQNQLNPYAQDATAMASMGGYYQGQGNFTQPVRSTKYLYQTRGG
jgi:hypothetical protein